MVADMLFGNSKAFQKVAKMAKEGFVVDDTRITIMGESHSGHVFKSTEKYELVLRDCRGTDACFGSYIWTVTADTLGDGYTYETKYSDTLVEGSELPENK